MGENFGALEGWLGHYGYPVLFALVFAESAGLPVPGETTVLAAAVLAGRPESTLRIEWVIVTVIAAAVLGDNLGFWAGYRWARPRLREGRRFLFLTPEALKTVEGYFEHYGALTVAFARFIAGLRVVAALAAGTSGMPWPRFLVANLAGAVGWAVAMSLLGYYFGQSWEALHHWLGRGALLIAGCVVLIVGIPYLWRRLRRVPPASWNRLLGGRVWEGALAAVLVVVCVKLLLSLALHDGRPTHEDRAVQAWVEARQGTAFDSVARVASYLGSLPVTAVVALLIGAWSRRSGGPWREQGGMLWALVGSEVVGLVLLALIRHEGIEPARAMAWPFGFAGLAPLRAAAVYGMAAHVTYRLAPRGGRYAALAAAAAMLLTGFSVVWQGQTITEVLVEYAAGGLVLFNGQWRIEGRGVGLLPGATVAATSDGSGQPGGTP
jgi:membrane protein DedA with SNARE-associated domain